MKKLIWLLVIVIITAWYVGCRDVYTASYNLSYEADMFQLERRIVFYNGITGEYMLVINGKCSIVEGLGQLQVTCKVAEDKYKKHFLGLSDNVTYFAEQLDGKSVSTYHYSVVFKPSVIVPDIGVR